MFSKPRKDFTEGPLFFRITLFALPVMLTGILQILYGMADNIVVGRFSGDIYALGAVGSTSSLNNLTLHLLLGLSVGSSVVVAQAYGAKREREVSRTAHTAMTTAVFGGIIFSPHKISAYHKGIFNFCFAVLTVIKSITVTN